MSSWWKNVEPAPKDPILGVTEAFLADPSPDKVNVGVGAYRDDNGKPVVLDCVREAERRIAGSMNMEYLPMGGSNKMVEETLKLAYGEDSDLIKDKRIAAIQALSGTGACRIFADFQKRFSLILISISQSLLGPTTITFGGMQMYHKEHFIIIIQNQKVLISPH